MALPLAFILQAIPLRFVCQASSCTTCPEMYTVFGNNTPEEVFAFLQEKTILGSRLEALVRDQMKLAETTPAHHYLSEFAQLPAGETIELSTLRRFIEHNELLQKFDGDAIQASSYALSSFSNGVTGGFLTGSSQSG
ncbi:hypothetical protein QFC20_007516 [Naganishia adeliensis]|uniref:Uncharacterized protein n=1 Tax=Naganishia adeliensis TaxID=92952 RepID=A0ACC2UZX3_9TREE|nr:hypothetical protein QFC20_007516 [Naganishia adeliensis]